MGRVVGLFVSNGGVPKLPVESIEITFDGIKGDKQNDLKHHGGRMRAVCLISNELIMKLQNEGHPILPGSTGENIIIENVKLVSGSRIKIGSAILEITGAAKPCSKISKSFTNGDFSRIDEKIYPNDTRWYCKVLQEGNVSSLENTANLIIS